MAGSVTRTDAVFPDPPDLDAAELRDLVAPAADAPGTAALSVGPDTWTFAELLGRVDALDAELSTRCRPGARVAVLSHNRAEYVAAYYGVPRAGRILVPLNPRLHPGEWLDQLARTQAELVIGEADLLERLDAAGSPDPGGPPAALRFEDLELDRGGRGRLAAGRPAGPDDTAMLMFTSGTSGRPKAVRLTHRNLIAGVRVSASGRPVRSDDVFCTPFPLCHIAGYQIMLSHAHGRPAVVLRRFAAPDLVAAVETHGVTSLSLAPTMISALLEHVEAHPEALAPLRAQLRVIAYGSAPMPPALLRSAMDTFGCDLTQGFGMTELSGNATFLSAADHRRAVTDRPALAASAGRAGPGIDLRVVDDDARPVGPDRTGEIVVRGEQVTTGYWNDREATEAVFLDGRTGCWFRTGDVGRLDADGYLYVLDRRKDVVITGGENVGSREVEDVLQAIPGVGRAAVIGVPDPYWGQRVCAVVVPDGAPPPEEEDLTQTCRSRLAGFKIPRRFVFVDELPTTPTGKVRKDMLRERFG